MNLDLTDYKSVIRQLMSKASVGRQPVSGTFELTSRCNLECVMCYVAEHACSKSAISRELTASEWVSIAEEAMQSGMVFLLLTGGEIFLRRDFFDIYEPLRKMGLLISLYTNGTLVTKSVAERLSKSRPNKIEITLYGANSKTYEEVTGIKKGFELCCNGIENLLAAGIKPVLKTTITNQNKHELEDMRKMGHDWGLPFLLSWLLTKRTDGMISDVENARLVPEEVLILEAQDIKTVESWKETARKSPVKSKTEIFYCSAGKSSFYINSSGKMNLCADLPLPASSVPEKGFKDAWEETGIFLDESNKKTSTCSSCSSNSLCNTCPAWSYLENKKLNEPVPYLCDITFKRKEEYSKQL